MKLALLATLAALSGALADRVEVWENMNYRGRQSSYVSPSRPTDFFNLFRFQNATPFKPKLTSKGSVLGNQRSHERPLPVPILLLDPITRQQLLRGVLQREICRPEFGPGADRVIIRCGGSENRLQK
ncbi:predicted protein [Uncinocarpus reesii 1704]|uniref:Uncharacterized protein n=1 Tax=Uncinocarpus reesii (strain UAMH 1704) TaxID=336963 RepID=C4JS45_UNCRE|nr:uncharacterized protein UREG_05284 [Uncinocarpus reesii 1704]EEP80442.1 predicted protein [Uncinocarpus reesii 1704]